MGDVMSLRLPCRAALSVIPFFLMTASASAHHVMGGKMPTTFAEGFLSGLGHPVIGPDHLAFLLAIGVAVGVGLNLVLPLLFVVASAIGVTLHVNGVNLPGAEIVVAVSVLFAGFLIARGRALPVSLWAILFAAAGLFHGYAFGESIFGAERSPLHAYLLGLIIVQSVLTVGTALFVRRKASGVSAIAPRLAGAVIIGVGLATLIAQLIPGA